MKSEVLQIRLTKEEKELLQKVARRNRMSMSEFLLYGAMKLITENEFYNKHNIYNTISLMLDLEQKGFSLMPNDIQIQK